MVGYLGNGITSYCDLKGGVILKRRCKSWCAHMFLVCSNYKSGSSVELGASNLIIDTAVLDANGLYEFVYRIDSKSS